MPIHEKNISTLVYAGAITSFLIGTHYIPISHIVGSWFSFFTFTSIIAPLSGAYMNGIGIGIIYALRVLIKFFIRGGNPVNLLLNHIPQLSGAVYWAQDSAWIRCIVPIVAMILFWIHPIGMQAWPYALVWCIPVLLHATRRVGIFATSLGSTLVTHAVGSVLWLYMVPMPASTWLALIPRVYIERFLFAALMTSVYYIVEEIRHRLRARIGYLGRGCTR